MKKYKDLYNEINQEIPFYVRMNMILIDGSDVKRLYLKICSDIIKNMERGILDNIIKVRNDRIE